MKKPIRIQRKRTKGWRMPPNTVYVGRPTEWGNPYTVGEYIHKRGPFRHQITVEEAVNLFRRDITEGPGHFEIGLHIFSELKGKNLACWCPLDQPCHADVLLEVANS